MKKTDKNTAYSIVSMIIIVAVIIVSIQLDFGGQMAVCAGSIAAVLLALFKGIKWADIQQASIQNLADCCITLFILIFIGMLIGIWLIGGTIPTLIYYGLTFISPHAIVPITFILCAVTSLFTGTSYGSLATMGLAMFGVGVNMGIPGVVMAGAAVSGSFFGDKMSPLSDTTNVASAAAGTDLYAHIGSMFYTTVPATIVTLILYVLIGLKYSSEAYDATTILLIRDTLTANYHIGLICLIPMVLVIVLAACRVPSVLSMMIAVIVSVVLAFLTQGAALGDIMSCALSRYVSETGVEMVDTILTRGGISSMTNTFSILLFAMIMAGALKASGTLEVFEHLVLKIVKSTRSLVVATLVFSWSMIAMTSNQMLSLIVPGKTMCGLYDELDVDRKVLSRSLEDSGTIGAVLIPWSNAAIYITGVLGVGIGYIPFAFFAYIVPVFSVICAFTGFGIWNSKGEPVRRCRKTVKRNPEQEVG